jgi:phosphate transport system substrate-binding protein
MQVKARTDPPNSQEVLSMKHAMSIFLVGVGLFIALAALRTDATAGEKITGEIKADGSSTVYLITEAMATSFKKLHPGVNITVGISGTGGGFKKFIAGETDVQDASRPIKPNEAEQCKEKGIAYTELQVGWDGLAVIINPDNTWARKMTMEQLRKIWHPDGQKTIKKWSDVDPSWPAEELKLFGAGADSGTFDYFTEAVNGKEKATRTDYTPTEDDNITVQAVSRNKYALGYLGVAYYEVNKKSLGVVALKSKKDNFVEPNSKTVLSREYPLSRPLYIYVKNTSLKRPEVREFADFYLRRSDLVEQAKYVKLSLLQQTREQEKLKASIGASSK